METVAIIAGAGCGERMGRQCKALLELKGKPLICYSLELFQNSDHIDGIYAVVPREILERFREALGEKGCRYGKLIGWAAGGSRRQDSVAAAMELIPANVSWIAVHDAARPFAGHDVLKRVVEAGRRFGAAVPGLSLVDTVKEVNGSGSVVRTADRGNLSVVQTPQFFSAELLRRAYRQAEEQGIDATDDAALVERIHGVKVVDGDPMNFKITTPFDLYLAEMILQSRG